MIGADEGDEDIFNETGILVSVFKKLMKLKWVIRYVGGKESYKLETEYMQISEIREKVKDVKIRDEKVVFITKEEIEL
jgi:hypothetical protein